MNGGVSPGEEEAHGHVVDVFIEGLVDITVEELVADKVENLAVVPPVEGLILQRRVF